EDTLNPATFDTIDKIASNIRGLPNSVRLEGHTDAIPIHTARFRSNWELSAARSIAMLDLLSTRCKIPLQRMAIAGYADTVPTDSNDTVEGRAHNRRVDVVILNQRVIRKDPHPTEPVPSVRPPQKKQKFRTPGSIWRLNCTSWLSCHAFTQSVLAKWSIRPMQSLSFPTACPVLKTNMPLCSWSSLPLTPYCSCRASAVRTFA